MFSHSLSLGLHIEDHTLRIVQLKKKGQSLIIERHAEVSLAVGVLDYGVPVDTEAVIAALVQLFTLAELGSPRGVELSVVLPDRQSYSQRVAVQHGSEKQMRTALEDRLVALLPIPAHVLAYSTIILEKSKTATTYLVSATSYEVVAAWKQIFDALKLKVTGFDIPEYAYLGAHTVGLPKSPVCLTHIGGDGTSIAYFDAQGLWYSEYAGVGIESLAAALLPTLSDSKKKKVKKQTTKRAESNTDDTATPEDLLTPARTTLYTNGLTQPTTEGTAVLERAYGLLCKQLIEATAYVGEGTEHTTQIGEYVFAGPGVQLPGAKTYCATQLSVPKVSVGTLLTNEGALTAFTGAIGAACRTLYPKWENVTPRIVLERPKPIGTVAPKHMDTMIELPNQIKDSSERQTIHANLQAKRQVLVLGLIILIGAGSLVLARWYRTGADAARQAEIALIQQQVTPAIPHLDGGETSSTPEQVDSTDPSEATISTTTVHVGEYAIVVGEETGGVRLLLAPAVGASSTYIVDVGEIVLVLDNMFAPAWVYVRTANSTTGYIEGERLEVQSP